MRPEERSFLERSLAIKHAERALDSDSYEQWITSGYTVRAICYFSKIFAVWRQWVGEPEVIDSLRVTALNCNPQEGFSARFTDSNGREVWVGHAPKKLFPDHSLWAHIPFMSDITYLPHESKEYNVLRFPVVFKSTSNPEVRLTEGDVYITQVGEFRAKYPKYKDLKL